MVRWFLRWFLKWSEGPVGMRLTPGRPGHPGLWSCSQALGTVPPATHPPRQHPSQLPLEARPSPGCTGHLLWGTLRLPVFC